MAFIRVRPKRARKAGSTKEADSAMVSMMILWRVGGQYI